MKTAVIVLPTYNERENITILIPEIFNTVQSIKNWDISILVVDHDLLFLDYLSDKLLVFSAIEYKYI